MFKTVALKFTGISILFTVYLVFFSVNAYAQVFTKITDTNNPIVTEILSGAYIGTSWVDVDNDERLDLFICRKDIFKNLGGGNFVKITNSIPLQGNVIGNSWADYDNDGYIDLFVVANAQAAPTSHLYKNNGDGTFTKILSGQIADSVSNTGWGCAWADYNNDGWTDLVIAVANGFMGVFHENRFFFNNGNGTFTRIDTTALTDTVAPYTVPVWSDYDQDGDIDLFIGSGPAGGPLARDFLFRNYLTEISTSYFQRIDTGVIGTDPVDGQNWNWIDYDNDGDMDAYLTNYRNDQVTNKLYKCEGLRYYISQTQAQVGDIVADNTGRSLANLWGDFDNDGDLDCFVTRDGQTSRYFSNNGNGTFTRIDNLAIVTGLGPGYGSTAGDYDNDGDLDLFVAGAPTAPARGLYRNDTQNQNKWVNIRCVGSGPANNYSNISALGTIIRAKATINGQPVWQIREINAQNSFNSMNALNVHFGFGNAAAIDSLVIKWPRGLIQVHTNVALNKFYKAIEGQGLTEIIIGIKPLGNEVPYRFGLYQNYPNPFNPVTKIKFEIPTPLNPPEGGKPENNPLEGLRVRLTIYDLLGREVATLINEQLKPGTYEVSLGATSYPSGVYFYRITAGEYAETRKMILLK